jgi:hypothetical protein
MKLTNEQLTQIIREELEQVLEGPKYSIADKEKKIAKRATRAEINMDDLIYKGDNYDIDDINKKIAAKMGAKQEDDDASES